MMNQNHKYVPLVFLLAVLLLLANSLTVTGESVKGGKSRFYRPSSAIVSSEDPSLAARCPICGDFLYKHNNPNFPDFRCIPANADRRGFPESRRMVCPICNNVFNFC